MFEHVLTCLFAHMVFMLCLYVVVLSVVAVGVDMVFSVFWLLAVGG